MRHIFGQDPDRDRQLFDLLDLVFPGLRAGAVSLRRFGTSWEAISTPYVRWVEGGVVSHVGIIPLDLIVMNTRVEVGSIHAVATHPGHRRRGHYRAVMEEALADSAKRFATLILSTEQPELYEPFGFRSLQEHCFTTACEHRIGGDGFRPLDVTETAERDLLLRLLHTREPVSTVLGAYENRAVFCFNESHRPLHYAADIDTLVCMERTAERIDLYDVVAPRIPSLKVLLARMPAPIAETVFHFAPDRLAVTARAMARVFDHDGPAVLMVRGPWAAEDRAFTLPRSART